MIEFYNIISLSFFFVAEIVIAAPEDEDFLLEEEDLANDEEKQKLAIANIVVSQSVEGFEKNESIQEKMISILNGTADARELAKACLEKYESL